MGRKKSLVGWIDYDKDKNDFVYPIYIFTGRPTTRHTNPDVVCRKCRITIEEIPITERNK